MTPPPAYKPKSKKRPDLIGAFFADPFDKRMRGADQELTPLGLSLQVYGELRRLLKREAPEALEFIDREDT